MKNLHRVSELEFFSRWVVSSSVVLGIDGWFISVLDGDYWGFCVGFEDFSGLSFFVRYDQVGFYEIASVFFG